MKQPKLDTVRLQSQLRRKSVLPKGTTDVTMERLFPERRSAIPVDDERREAVYAILVQVGALKGEEDVEDEYSEDGIGQGTSSPEREGAYEPEEALKA